MINILCFTVLFHFILTKNICYCILHIFTEFLFCSATAIWICFDEKPVKCITNEQLSVLVHSLEITGSQCGNYGNLPSLQKFFVKSIHSKFLDARIQDVSTSISIRVRILKNLNDLTERYDDEDDESDKHLEARDRRYSCLKL